MTKLADLHVHTFFSDGTYSPEELISETAKHGLSAVAVVDHDTVDGIEAVREAAKTKDIEILPAIELTAEYEGIEIHILGYLINHKNEALKQMLTQLKANRVERVYKIIDKLNLMGVKLNPQVVFELAKKGSVGRLHIARAMAQEGLVNSIFEAFRRYIGDKCPAYVCGFRLSPYEAISLIENVGGVPVLAHPYTIGSNELIPELVKGGLKGLEVYYPEHSPSMVKFYSDLAKKLNLLVTGGSDCHGFAKPEVKIGSVKVPYELVEKLKSARDNLKPR
jgi:predicted metal-dependent phosphoesterase TrpH